MNRRIKISPVAVAQHDLIARQLPADYVDAYMGRFICDETMGLTPEKAQRFVWVNQSVLVEKLMALRNLLVRPLGLKGSLSQGETEAWIQSGQRRHRENAAGACCDELMVDVDDKHLRFYLSIKITTRPDQSCVIVMATAVQIKNWQGQLYFTAIRLFHGLLVRHILRRIIRQYGQKS